MVDIARDPERERLLLKQRFRHGMHLEPGLHYLPQVYADLARAQGLDGGK